MDYPISKKNINKNTMQLMLKIIQDENLALETNINVLNIQFQKNKFVLPILIVFNNK